MEPLVGLVLAFVLAIGIRVYLRWFAAGAARQPSFERWCASRPLVMAFLCHDELARDVGDDVRHLLGNGEFFNRSGPYPWQHYVVYFEQRRLDDATVGIFVIGCRLERARVARPDIEGVLAGLSAHHAAIDEVWLHGQLHRPEWATRAPRPRAGWVGHYDEAGTLQLTEMIGVPEWLPSAPAGA